MYIVNGAVLERWSSLTDEQIVAQVVAGQTALFELLMRRHHERLYCAALTVLGDDREAEDVMQQAYLNAYARLRQFDRRARFATWLTAIVNDVLARVAIARELTAASDAFAIRPTRCDRVVAAVLRRIE